MEIPATQRYRLLWLAALLLFAAVIAAALYKGWDVLFPPVAVQAAVDPDCDLHQGACRSRLPSGAVIGLAIEPRSLPVFKPIRLSVTTEGLDADGVEVDFSGVDMNMGFIRPRLEPTGEGRFEGTTMLPVCIRSQMTWEAKVLVHTADGLVAAPFQFETVNEGAFPP